MWESISPAKASRRGALAITALVAALAMSGTPALAQAEKKEPAAKEAPKQPAPAGDAKAAKKEGGDAAKSANWAKICSKVPVVKRDKEGKETKEEKGICVTLHDIVDGTTGLTVVSAAVRTADDAPDKQDLMMTVPLGMIIPAGVRVVLFNKDQWEKAAKKEEVDEKALKSIDLKFQVCLPNGCVAEVDAPKEVIDSMKAGGGMVVRSIQTTGQIANIGIGFEGFGAAFDGKPVDNKQFAEARKELMAAIQARRKELVDTFKKEKAEQDKKGGGDPKAAKADAKAPPAKGAAPPEKK